MIPVSSEPSLFETAGSIATTIQRVRNERHATGVAGLAASGQARHQRRTDDAETIDDAVPLGRGLGVQRFHLCRADQIGGLGVIGNALVPVPVNSVPAKRL